MGIPLPNNWRGPHDPPGSRFRREQTLQLYGYQPRPEPSADEAPRAIVEPVREFIHVADTFQETPPNARLSLIEARRLVNIAREHQGDYSKEELRPYAEDLEKLVLALLKDLKPDSKLLSRLKNLFSK